LERLEKRDSLSPWLLNFAVEYAIRRVEVKQDGFKLNSTHQLLVYGDDVNIMGGRVSTITNKEVLLARSKEIGLEVLIKMSI